MANKLFDSEDEQLEAIVEMLDMNNIRNGLPPYTEEQKKELIEFYRPIKPKKRKYKYRTVTMEVWDWVENGWRTIKKRRRYYLDE